MYHARWEIYFLLVSYKCLLPVSLDTAFPAIYSHHLNQNAFVHTVMHDEINSALRNRLASVAMQELVSLRVLLQDVVLAGLSDCWTMIGSGEPFSTKVAYSMMYKAFDDPAPNHRLYGVPLASGQTATMISTFGRSMYHHSSLHRCNLPWPCITPERFVTPGMLWFLGDAS